MGGRPARVAPLPSVAPPHNLPVLLTSFVGRERELGELAEALAATRLLTLTGPGGCGKTRLALRLASETLERFPDGVWWVGLASLAGDERVGAAITEALGVRPLPGMTELQAAGAYLGSRRALVILDNCEHLARACAEAVESLLQASPGSVVLATSRAPLGVGGETDWRVPSMSLPEAVSLFAQRAGKVRPGFAVTSENAEVAARVCREVDGLPLAIELAAARVRMLSPDQIAEGLSDRFRMLTGGPRTATPRQRTLRASVDWSHELLADEERVLLRRVAVFAGGFTLAAVEEVCAGDGLQRAAVLDVLGALVDQSLVIAEEGDRGVRYQLLELVRQYGLERLSGAGEEASLRACHRDAFLAFAELAAPHLETGNQREWLEVLDPEAPNLATAVDHALATDPPAALRLCAALYRWWRARGRLREARRAQSLSLDGCPDREPALRARVHVGSAVMAILATDPEAAEAHAAEALALADEAGDRSAGARARVELAAVLLFTNAAAARAEAARAGELARAAGDDWALVEAKQVSAIALMWQSELGRAAHENHEVAALAERLGDPNQVGMRWYLVAWMARAGGRLAEAQDACERIRAAVEGVGEPLLETLAEQELAMIGVMRGETQQAIDRMETQLERALRLGVANVVPAIVVTQAVAELVAGRLEPARARIEGLLPLITLHRYGTSWALGVLADVQRLLGDEAAEPTALEAQAIGDEIGNRMLASAGRMVRGRLAAACSEWAVAQGHALAHLDVCVVDGYQSRVPVCLDALAEVAAGLHAHEDAVRLLAAAERARDEMGIVRGPAEEHHWASIDSALHEALGDDAYELARRQGAELSTADALEWARRARGPRGRPPGGWESLTPTERKVVELVTQGFTNREVGERMFISPETAKAHLAHVYRKLDVGGRAELTALAVRREAST